MENSNTASHLPAKIRKAANQHQKEKKYWLEKLAGNPVKSSFPLDNRGTPAKEEIKTVYFNLNGIICLRLNELTKGNDYIFHIYMTATLTVLLARQTGNTDIVISTPIYRQESGDELINSILPLRSVLIPGITFRELLRQVKDNLTRAEANQNYPMELVAEHLNLSTGPEQEFPLFDTAVLVEKIHDLAYLRRIKHNVVFSLQTGEEQVKGIVYYNSRLYGKDSILRIGNQFRQILAEVLPNLDKPVWEIDILPEEEKKTLLVEFNNTAVESLAAKTLPGLITNQEAYTPDRIALLGQALLTNKSFCGGPGGGFLEKSPLAAGGKKKETKGTGQNEGNEENDREIHLTYRELNEQSNHLARLLQEKGNKTDSITALMVDRSVEMIIAILGILKSGGAYLPIDPDYPQERIDFMLKDSGADILLTGSEITGFSSPQAFKNCPKGTPSHLHLSPAPATSLAYTIYTSGSTGSPKGVMIEHRAVLNFIKGITDVIDIRAADSLYSLTTICFDIFGLEAFVPLARGAKVVIGNRREQVDPAAAARVISREQITIFQLTPSRLQLFFSSGTAPKSLENLRYLLVGGEAFPGKLFREAGTLVRGKIFNLYGPTETTIWSAVKDLSGQETVDIGKPIANTYIYILDSRYSLVPIGAAGEIHIGGQGTARGYLNKPELTNEKFCLRRPGGENVTHGIWRTVYETNHIALLGTPRRGTPAPRKNFLFTYSPTHPLTYSPIYCTGDLGRWLPDGNIEFLGRVDYQVKIRGNRVELGEIETRLLTHDKIKEAVVIDREDTNGNKYICAYYVLKSPGGDNRNPGTAELREHLSQTLPGYMIPSYFISLERLPLTHNGKIERKALPAPEAQPGRELTAPRDEIEEKLAMIWDDVLKAEAMSTSSHQAIGIDDNFFHLGGHSLNAAILVTRIYKALEVNIPLGDIFKYPTIRGQAGYIKNSATRHYEPIEANEKREYYSLSSAQKRLYFLYCAGESNITYNMPLVLALEAKIDREKLEQTFKKLIARHESLRTFFELVGDSPVQRIQEEVEFSIEYFFAPEAKGRTKPAVCDTRPVTSVINSFVRPFALTRVPLLRVGLVQLENTKYIFLLDMHHIITDGTSQALFIKEFTTFYTSDVAAGNPEPLRTHYKDYTIWQQSKKEQERVNRQGTYWEKEYSAEIPVLELPYDKSRPAIQNFAGETVTNLLEEKETAGLKQIAGENRATLFMVLLAIYNILLAKLSGQEDIVIGTPAAARLHPDLEQIMGLFINTLAIRNYPGGEKTFREFLAEVKTQSLNAFENQEYPFADLVNRTVKERDQARNPLFDILFALQNIETPAIILPGIKLAPYPYTNHTAKFDLAMNTIETGEGLAFNFQYCTGLFNEQTIRRYSNYFKKIIDRVIENPDTRLAAIEIITAQEKTQLLFEFNETVAAQPYDKSIHELYSEMARREPDRLALGGTGSYEAGTIQITYKELDRKSAAKANRLREQGVRPGTIAAIRDVRTIELIIVILGILKAGGAYLPIDPGNPQERIDFMLKDSGANILLTGSKITDFSSPQVFKNCPKGTPSHLHLSPAPATSLAYIIYTSGTTARPKGVMIDHQNVLRLASAPDYIQFQPGQRLLMTGALVFDICTFEIWGPLLNGLSLYIAEKEAILEIGTLKETVIKNIITILHLIPQLFNQIWEHYPETFAGLEYFLVGGDLVRPEPINRLRIQYPHLKIIHCYGPTENTTFTTTLRVEKTYERRLPIGKPINGTYIYILDQYEQLRPIGVTGELYAGGAGIARGYLNNPELTNEKFCLRRPGGRFLKKLSIASPRRGAPAPRKNFLLTYSPTQPLNHSTIYRTGDLARWLVDGNIEFLGRIDNQVKIRGHRIELSEIENRLLKHEAIKDALVIMEQFLCAYIVANREIEQEKIKEYLSRHLPGYMLPTHFIKLAAFPLNPNGKIDRKALPLPAIMTNSKIEAPGNEIEKKLLEIWSEVLGNTGGALNSTQKKIGINDNFFQLGGDSIKAIQVSSRLRQYGWELKINDIFRHPVIKELAGSVKKIQRQIQQGPVEGEVPLTPIQRHFFLENPGLIHRHHFNQAVMLYRPGGFDPGILRQVLTRLVEHHDALRMVFAMNAPGGVTRETDKNGKNGEKNIPNQRNRGKDGTYFHLEVFDFTAKDDNCLAGEIETRAGKIQESIDLENGPLVKVGLFKTHEGDHLLIVIHHLVIDGISWRILLEDLRTWYSQLKQGKAIHSREKTDSFKYWAEQLIRYAREMPSKTREIQYWQALESKAANVLPLPRDHQIPPGKNKNKYLESITLGLSREETENLLGKVNQAYKTRNDDILLTALGKAVAQWAGTETISIELEGHGREPIIPGIDISRTVGWYTAQYPVILEVKQSWEIGNTIKYIKETLRRIPNKGTGYGILKYLTPRQQKPEMSFTIKPGISFNYLGQLEPPGGSTVQPGEEAGNNNMVFTFSRYNTGKSSSPEIEQSHSLMINGIVTGGKLRLSFSYNTHEYDETTIRALVDNYKVQLLNIIRHCTRRSQAGETELTPGDVMEPGNIYLSLEEFSRITKHIDEKIPGKPTIKSIYPLSPMQKGMLYHSLTGRQEDVYFNQFVIQLQGAIQPILLESSVDKLIERYDIFRTVFLHNGLSEPLQVVLSHGKARFHYEDISGKPAIEQDIYMEEARKKDKAGGFEIDKDIPVRQTLFRTGEDSYLLLWNQHHILMDGWCIGIIFQELLRLHEGLRQSRPVELGDVVPYKNYIAWLEEQDKSAGLRYWEKYLEGYDRQAALPMQWHGKTVTGKTYKLNETILEISHEETLALDRQAANQGITVNTIFQALWGILLQKYNNTGDVVFGVVVSGRPEEIPGIENMVGLFINTVPLRIQTHPHMEYTQLLRNLRESNISSRDYEFVPLAEIQAKSSLKGNLIDHLLVFENYPFQGKDTTPGIKVKHLEIYEQSNYPFNIVIVPGRPPGTTRVRFSYNALVYNEETVKRVGRHLAEILRRVIEEPEVRIDAIEMLTREEKNRLLFDVNQTDTANPGDKCCRQLFLEQAQRRPDHTALIGTALYNPLNKSFCGGPGGGFLEKSPLAAGGKNDDQIHLTYRELNENANRLAAILMEKGIQPDMAIGIMLPPSLDMMVGILGILNSGAAYLPIDPETPRERIEFMLKDSSADILLTGSEITDFSSPQAFKNCPKGAPSHLHLSPAPATSLAYIIYTSGSTGRPKGVMIEHKSLLNLCHWHNRAFAVTERDRATKYAAPAFDASVWETFPYLIAGASIYIVPAQVRLDMALLNDYFEMHHITIAFLPTQACEQFMKIDDCSLRVMLTGGDKLKSYTPRRYTLVNNYGPTENTVVTTSYTIETGSPAIPIGKPIFNNRIYILDRNGNLQPEEVPGELCIAGDGLARGYLNNPELTNKKFLRGSRGQFLQKAPPGRRGQIIYRTGDLARWLVDGNIEFLGRNDQQVKIRGYRIEPGEIETRLLNNEQIKDVIVLARETPTGDRYLCAYIVSENDIEPQTLKANLSKEIPAYMIPSYFIRLEKIPLTANGKINKNALPSPGINESGDYTAPRNNIEEQLEEIWRQLLGAEKGVIGIDSNFFQVGGHSLKAAALTAKIYETFNISISLAEIFEAPTIREIASLIKAAEWLTRQNQNTNQDSEEIII